MACAVCIVAKRLSSLRHLIPKGFPSDRHAVLRNGTRRLLLAGCAGGMSLVCWRYAKGGESDREPARNLARLRGERALPHGPRRARRLWPKCSGRCDIQARRPLREPARPAMPRPPRVTLKRRRSRVLLCGCRRPVRRRWCGVGWADVGVDEGPRVTKGSKVAAGLKPPAPPCPARSSASGGDSDVGPCHGYAVAEKGPIPVEIEDAYTRKPRCRRRAKRPSVRRGEVWWAEWRAGRRQPVLFWVGSAPTWRDRMSSPKSPRVRDLDAEAHLGTEEESRLLVANLDDLAAVPKAALDERVRALSRRRLGESSSRYTAPWAWPCRAPWGGEAGYASR